MIRPATCPICGKTVPPATDPHAGVAPFCSVRCKQIDFFRWNDGRYAIVESLDASRTEALPSDDAELEDPSDE